MKEDKKSDGIRVVNFAAYKPTQIGESIYYSRPYVWYGDDNLYPNYLIDRFNNSPTNGVLISKISDMIYGKGLVAKDAFRKPNEYAAFKSLIKKKDVRKLTNDLKLFGQCSLQVIYNADHTKIVEVAHVPFERLRAEVANDEGEIEGYYYAKNWSNINGKNKPVRFPAFGTSEEGLEIMMIKPYRSGSFYYASPDYAPALTYAVIEEEIQNYHVTNIQNGFSPSTLINFNNGQAETNEEKREIEKKINKKFGGASGNKILLSFNDSPEEQTTIETIDISDASEQYQFLAEQAQEKLMQAHGITSPMLFGLNSANGFASNSQEIQVASVYMYQTSIRPFQELIIDGIDEILSFNKISLDLEFETLQPWIDEDVENNNEENNTEE